MCKIARAFDAGLTPGRQTKAAIFQTQSTDGAVSDIGFDGFDGFDGFSLKGYVRVRARPSLSYSVPLATERIRQIRQTRQLPRAVGRLATRRLPSNRRQTGVKWWWLCCQT